MDTATLLADPAAIHLECIPPWMCGAETNHNETLVRDAAPVK